MGLVLEGFAVGGFTGGLLGGGAGYAMGGKVVDWVESAGQEATNAPPMMVKLATMGGGAAVGAMTGATSGAMTGVFFCVD